MKPEVKTYLAKIGRSGGKKSRRTLDRTTARNMVRVRELRRNFRRYWETAFSERPRNYRASLEDAAWIVAGLRKHGGEEGKRIADKLCH